MINFGKILNEGRYDSLTRIISNDILYIIKNTIDEDGVVESELPYDINKKRSYKHESGIKIPVVVYIQRLDRLSYGGEHHDYYVNTYISNDDELVMEISLNPNKEPKLYESLFYKINEDVRHEIEHYTQKIMDDKPSDTTGTAGFDTTYEHHKDSSEIPAMVHGFYRRARIEKKPIDVVMWDDLDSEINSGNLTKDEAQDLFNLWINYSRRRLPKAIYSN